MRVDLLHNKIVRDTVSDKFIESFNKILLPKLKEKYPEAEAVVLYEDYLSDGLFAASSFFCPLTLIYPSSAPKVFASWRVDAKNFEDSVPYSYRGNELLNFELPDELPRGFEEKIAGRVEHFAPSSASITVEANAPTKTFLSGKYSQSFVDVMSDAVTRALEREFNIGNISESSVELRLVFAPESFMEHVFDNVSYRRLLISARACSPRDLWIKWTGISGEKTYTVSDHIKEGDVLFEIADEVPEKIREKEFRYLISASGHAAYKNAMSRKSFTEWRELLKRVIKRGEVEVYESEAAEQKDAPVIAESTYTPPVAEEKQDSFNDSAFDSDISLKLRSVLGRYDIEAEKEEEASEDDINPDITDLLRSLINAEREEDAIDAETVIEELSAAEEPQKPEEEIIDDGIPPFVIEEEDEPLVLEAENEPEAPVVSEREEPEEEEPEEETEEEVVAQNEAPNYSSLQDELSAFDYDKENNSRLDSLLSEIEALKADKCELAKGLEEKCIENDKLRSVIDEYESELSNLKSEIEVLRESVMAKIRSDDREMERLAEAARITVEQQRESDVPKPVELNHPAPSYTENNTFTSQVIDEEARAREAKEAERLEKERLEKERLEALRLEKERLEAEAMQKAPEPVRYVSKVADISFHHPVDPNITKRIQEIIITTVKYFGKEDVYMKIKASIPEPNMVRLDFLKIPENEMELLCDIIRVLGNSNIGITKVLLD